VQIEAVLDRQLDRIARIQRGLELRAGEHVLLPVLIGQGILP
jgi:hypothetical protein